MSSPRSIEACKVLGIEEEELLIKDKSNFENDIIPPHFLKYKDEYAQTRAEVYERGRIDRLQ